MKERYYIWCCRKNSSTKYGESDESWWFVNYLWEKIVQQSMEKVTKVCGSSIIYGKVLLLKHH